MDEAEASMSATGGSWGHLCIGQRFDVCARPGAADEDQVSIAGGAQHLDDEAQLVDVVLAREQRLPVQQLCQDAAHRPVHIRHARLTTWHLTAHAYASTPAAPD